MKLTQIVLALASLAAAPAFAVHPTPIPNGTNGSLDHLYGVGGVWSGTSERIVYVSGSSALSGSLGRVIADTCVGAELPA